MRKADKRFGLVCFLHLNLTKITYRSVSIRFLQNRDIPENKIQFDNSDKINSNYIIDKISLSKPVAIVVIDYLQLLDQRRETPGLDEQIFQLKSFAIETGLFLVFLSQIDRSYELSNQSVPDMRC